jgi:EpsI family protein
MESATRRSLLIGSALGVFAGAAKWLQPKLLFGTHRPAFTLEQAVPKQFGPWIADSDLSNTVTDPVTSEKLRSIYTALLTRTYRDKQGNAIMLSLAYVLNHSDAGSVHYPNVCYPAQGFEILSQARGQIKLGTLELPMHRMEARQGSRHEPVSYWIVVGEDVTTTPNEAKLAQLRLTAKNFIADGMLVRVSTILKDTQQAWLLENKFISDLYAALGPEARLRLFGRPP